MKKNATTTTTTKASIGTPVIEPVSQKDCLGGTEAMLIIKCGVFFLLVRGIREFLVPINRIQAQKIVVRSQGFFIDLDCKTLDDRIFDKELQKKMYEAFDATDNFIAAIKVLEEQPGWKD
jgi:hypothetical protein